MEIDKKTIKALSADARLEILKALKQRRKMPSELAKELGLAPSTIVEHLKILEESGLIERKDTGRKWIYYELTNKGESLITPKIPVQFVLMLSLGLIVMLSGFLNIYSINYEFSTIPVERQIPSEGGKVLGPGVTSVPQNETIIENQTIVTEVRSVNNIALLLVSLGIFMTLMGTYRLLRR